MVRKVRVLNREKTWECYLPAGTVWYDYWTNEKYEGGQYVTGGDTY